MRVWFELAPSTQMHNRVHAKHCLYISILKDEISRVAQKEIRVETQSLKNAAAACRTEIAARKSPR